MTPAIVAYRGMTDALPRLLAELDRRMNPYQCMPPARQGRCRRGPTEGHSRRPRTNPPALRATAPALQERLANMRRHRAGSPPCVTPTHPPPHRARKRFGQNFLVDRHYIQRIVDAIDPRPEQRIVEIGPGQGCADARTAGGDGCTLRHGTAASLDVVKFDRDLVARLTSEFPSDRLRVHEADALMSSISQRWQRTRSCASWATCRTTSHAHPVSPLRI